MSSPDENGIVVFARQGKPPLRFRGRRLTQDQRHLSNDVTITVELWQQRNGGLVMSYTALDGTEIGSRAIQVSNLAEATDCLENVCANFDHPLMQASQGEMLWSELHLQLCFKQGFRLLVAEVLSAWHRHPQLQEFT